MSNAIALRPSYWASVSGGKDSLYMLNLILHNLDKYPLDGVVHYELEIDYPFVRNVIDFMETACKSHGIPFFRIKPRTTWKELYDKYGFPSSRARWCNASYKLDAQKQLKQFLAEKGFNLISYIGYCADEAKRANRHLTRKTVLNKNGSSVQVITEIYPLLENGINEDVILEWAKNQPIFNDFYKFNRRCGCMGCPMASMAEMAYLAKYYPVQYESIIQLASASEKKEEERYGRPISKWSGEAKYNTEYRDKRVKEKYLPELEKALKQNIVGE